MLARDYGTSMTSSQGTLLLVRHGHTASNGEGLAIPMSGWTNVPLSSQGMHQARALARLLATERFPDIIYTSPLERALRTACTIGAVCPARIEEDPDLREIYCGEADGLSLDVVRRLYPDHWRKNLEQCDPEFCWPGGECYRELRERALSALSRISSAYPVGRVVVVTHAGVISQVMGFIHGVSAACWEAFRPRNGSVSEIALSPAGMQIVRFDELPASHGEDEERQPDSSPSPSVTKRQLTSESTRRRAE